MASDEIRTVTVVGAGTMGEGIAEVFAQAGRTVRIVDTLEENLKRCLSLIEGNVKLLAKFGLVDESPGAILGRITPLPIRRLGQALKGADLVVETIPEILEVKRKLYGRLDALPSRVVIASNTSSIPITQLAEGMNTPERVIGVHFFNPAHLMPLVEIHLGRQTSGEVAEQALRVMRDVGKTPVLIRKALPGFIINRITGAMMREIYHLLDEGVATPEEIDLAVKNSTSLKLACFGPMELEDMAGLDIAYRVHSRTFKTLDNRRVPSPLLLERANRGNLGYKSGKGWLDYAGAPYKDIVGERNRRLLEQLALRKTGAGRG
jgi:3-hydroxybutyryl-CoA dehydrogenase